MRQKLKTTIKIIFLLITSSHFFVKADITKPSPRDESKTAPSFVIRGFYQLNEETKLIPHYRYEKRADRNFHQFGSKIQKKIDQTLHYGAQLNLNSGERNENDWKLNGGTWGWEDEKAFEFETSVYLLKKIILSKSMRVDLVAEGIRNWSEVLFTLAPEIRVNYFLSVDKEFFSNIYFKYKPYIPLNFSREDVYRESFYLGMFFNYTDKLKPTIFLKHMRTTWNESEQFTNLRAGSYSFKSDLTFIGLGLNYYF